MKYYQYQHLPGWKAERRVITGPGGHVVVIDRRIAIKLKGNARWCVMHIESGNSHCFSSQRKAKEAIRLLAVGNDEWGILPPEPKTISPIELVEQAETTVLPPDGSSSSPHNQISQLLIDAFPDEEITRIFEELLTAEKPDGSPDWSTRRGALRDMLAYRNGQPLKMEMIIHRTEDTSEEAIVNRLSSDPTYLQAMVITLQQLLAMQTAQLNPTQPANTQCDQPTDSETKQD